MMKKSFLVLLALSLVCCSGLAEAGLYTFTWTGVVIGILDSNYYLLPSYPGINIGDTYLNSTTYETTAFGAGVDVGGFGRQYAAPAGLQMHHNFSSGGVFDRNISEVQVLDLYLSNDLWNWVNQNQATNKGVFQAVDSSTTSFALPLPSSFDQMHTIFQGNLTNFTQNFFSTMVFYFGPNPEDYIQVTYNNQTISINAVPLPTGLALTICGLGRLLWYRRRTQ
jgi:hypothetical protein